MHPGHARKMVKRLQDRGHGATTEYYENIEGGHGGAANNTQSAFMSTLSYQFLWNKLNGSGNGGGGATAKTGDTSTAAAN